MMVTHENHAHAADLTTLVPVVAVVLLALGYLGLAWVRSREPAGWNSWRTTAFLAGAAALAAGLLPALNPFSPGDLRGHMYQHLLIGMYAPLGLVLGAPITLLLRSLPRRHGRRIGRVLRSAPVALLSHPVTALILNVGGMYLLYCTPLYEAAERNPLLHHAIHVHFLLSGYLFAYAIAGADPSPHRTSVPFRLVLLGVAITGHAVLAQLLYAGLLSGVTAPLGQLRGAGDLMYYGGDIAELLLALAVVTTWRRGRVQLPRRHGSPAAAH